MIVPADYDIPAKASDVEILDAQAFQDDPMDYEADDEPEQSGMHLGCGLDTDTEAEEDTAMVTTEARSEPEQELSTSLLEQIERNREKT